MFVVGIRIRNYGENTRNNGSQDENRTREGAVGNLVNIGVE